MNKSMRKLAIGLGFLAPNILGFLIFILGPLIFSLFLAFTNWDLRLHNMFKDEPLQFVLLENFVRLFDDPDFWQYLGNTLFLMMAIPFSIAGSLLAAIFLSQDMRGGSNWVWQRLIASAGLIFGLGCLVAAGAGVSAMILLVGGLASLILVGGTLGGTTVYRTLFFMPHFTSGVATYILWKKLYNPSTGPITNALRPLLESIGNVVGVLPDAGVQSGAWICALSILFLFGLGIKKLYASWRDGELGTSAVLLGSAFLVLPPLAALRWSALPQVALPLAGGALIALFVLAAKTLRGRDYPCQHSEGLGNGLMLGAVLMVAQFVFLGLGNLFFHLPAMAAEGLEPPDWLTDYNWAKPALMFMGLWAAVGSNNMLLYLAGLTNVPSELYEAAQVDGASPFQKFWHVTWPQLAPITFFIVVMSTIGGLQGGFEMARVMTKGGPAGATTTLSYFVYNEGFTTGRLGYAAGISWAMFALVFSLTLFNWKFGNRQVND
ncbi:MAG: hypothetical protein CME16_05500 [Gemmatimonadetes bacterium]|nr:hypothetical protein [Gemmatimonadota bacterium]